MDFQEHALLFKGHDLWTCWPEGGGALCSGKTINMKYYHVCGRFCHIVTQINGLKQIVLLSSYSLKHLVICVYRIQMLSYCPGENAHNRHRITSISQLNASNLP